VCVEDFSIRKAHLNNRTGSTREMARRAAGRLLTMTALGALFGRCYVPWVDPSSQLGAAHQDDTVF